MCFSPFFNYVPNYNYGVMLHKGRGVPVNLKKAAKYYEMSADSDSILMMI